jgi:hypothetical protein
MALTFSNSAEEKVQPAWVTEHHPHANITETKLAKHEKML